MKTLTMRFMIAVAALAVAAGSASAQTFKAQIPMSFRVNDALMTPGSYEVRLSTGTTGTEIVYVHAVESKRTVVLLGGPKSDVPKEWKKDGSPRLAFACTAGTCSLSQLYNGESDSATHFKTPSHHNVEARGTTVVTLAMIKVR